MQLTEQCSGAPPCRGSRCHRTAVLGSSAWLCREANPRPSNCKSDSATLPACLLALGTLLEGAGVSYAQQCLRPEALRLLMRLQGQTLQCVTSADSVPLKLVPSTQGLVRKRWERKPESAAGLFKTCAFDFAFDTLEACPIQP